MSAYSSQTVQHRNQIRWKHRPHGTLTEDEDTKEPAAMVSSRGCAELFMACAGLFTAKADDQTWPAEAHPQRGAIMETEARGRTWATMYMAARPLMVTPSAAVRRMPPMNMREAVVTEPHLRPIRSPTKPRVNIPMMMPATCPPQFEAFGVLCYIVSPFLLLPDWQGVGQCLRFHIEHHNACNLTTCVPPNWVLCWGANCCHNTSRGLHVTPQGGGLPQEGKPGLLQYAVVLRGDVVGNGMCTWTYVSDQTSCFWHAVYFFQQSGYLRAHPVLSHLAHHLGDPGYITQTTWFLTDKC